MNFHLSNARPTRIEDLDGTEYLLVWCLRRWLAGHAQRQPALCESVWNELAAALGAARGRQGLGALVRLVCVLSDQAERPFRYHPPCCGWLTAEESQAAALVVHLGSGDLLRARGLAEWLVRPDGVADLLAAAAQLAAALRDDTAAVAAQ